MSHLTKPEMTVIINVDRQRDRGRLALQSVLSQDVLDDLEILLYDFSPGAPPIEGSDDPHVRVIPMRHPIDFGQLRALAVRESRAPIVTFLEEHARALPGWAAALIKRHREPWAGISGEVHSGNPGQAIPDAVGLMNYILWHTPATAGEAPSLPGQNVSYKRDILLRYGDRLPQMIGADLILDWKLREDGYRLYLEPAARFAHANESSIRSIVVGTFWWNRMFTVHRAAVWRWSPLHRAVRLLSTPLVPLIRVVKQMLFVARRRPALLPRFIACIPVALAMHSGAALGQAVGLLCGLGASEQVFLEYELNHYRGVPGIAELRS